MNKKIKLISTNSVISISVTGNCCELSCKHCNKKYLKAMTYIENKDLNILIKDKNTALISGGSLKNTSIPFYEKYEKIIELKRKNILLNAHTGYIPNEQFEKTLIFDAISMDIVGNDKILKEIYNADISLGKLQENILIYCDYLKKHNDKKPLIVPHITIGIYYGKNSWEEDAIDFLSKISPQKLVLNVIIPTKNTIFEKIEKVKIERIIEIFKYSKKILPETLIYLGCMRPFGDYREKLDYILVENGIDAIVNPSKRFLRKINLLNQSISSDCFEIQNGCCALI